MTMTYAQARRAFGDLQGIAQSALEAHRATMQRIEALKQDERYAPEYRQKLINEEQATADQVLATARADVDRTHAVLQSTAQQQDAPSADTSAALLRETRVQRAWERIRPLLDAGRTWSKVVEQSEAARDGHALLALREEFPAWAQAQQKRSPGMVALLDTDVNLDDAHNAIDGALYRVLGDDGGQGSAARTRLFIAADYPLAVAKLDQAGNLRPGESILSAAIGVRFAEREAERINAMAGDQPAA